MNVANAVGLVLAVLLTVFLVLALLFPGEVLMSSSLAGAVFVGTLILALAAAYRPVGYLLYRVATSPRHLAPERLIYRLGHRDNTSGIGLGLALSRGLIEAMGGTLAPEATPGGGLTMTISRPAAPMTADGPRALLTGSQLQSHPDVAITARHAIQATGP